MKSSPPTPLGTLLARPPFGSCVSSRPLLPLMQGSPRSLGLGSRRGQGTPPLGAVERARNCLVPFRKLRAASAPGAWTTRKRPAVTKPAPGGPTATAARSPGRPPARPPPAGLAISPGSRTTNTTERPAATVMAAERAPPRLPRTASKPRERSSARPSGSWSPRGRGSGACVKKWTKHDGQPQAEHGQGEEGQGNERAGATVEKQGNSITGHAARGLDLLYACLFFPSARSKMKHVFAPTDESRQVSREPQTLSPLTLGLRTALATSRQGRERPTSRQFEGRCPPEPESDG